MNEMTLAEATKIVVDTAWACTVDEPAKYFKEEDYERDMAAIEIVKASLGIPEESEQLKRTAAEKIGELVTALGILPPGEDAVANFDQVIEAARKLRVRVEELEARWNYIKTDTKGARSLLLLLATGKGTPDDFDTMVDRIIESRNTGEKDRRRG